MSDLNDQVLLMLGRLEGKVDALIMNHTAQEARIGQHEGRLGRLEQSRSYALGAAAAVGAIVSFAVNFWRS